MIDSVSLSPPASPRRRALPLALLTSILLSGITMPALGAQGPGGASEPAARARIAEALAAVPEDVRVFNDHLTILASPWMEGRLPGTRGMELAMEYMEYSFRKSGLRAPFPAEIENADGTLAVEPFGSYRQAFRLGTVRKVDSARFALEAGDQSLDFGHGVDHDFTVTALGTGGSILAEAVYVGYAIDRGPDGFTSFADGADLTGKVAVMLRFEPMNAEGWSQWRDGRKAWSSRAGFGRKLKAVEDRGAVGAIIINTPGTADSRASSLLADGGSSAPNVAFPVVHLSEAAGERMVARATGGRESLVDWRRAADVGPLSVTLPGHLRIDAKMDAKQVVAENVIGVLPGKGRLAAEYVVVGAHLDHLGMGEFGSRDTEFSGRKLHPGADDNASGSAGIMLIADKMSKDYAELPEGVDARSIVFIGFSAEESGLNGSAHYVANPIGPIEDHVLMMNFDMIGRIANKRLSLSGTETGAGLAAFLDPILAASPLKVIASGSPSGGSDHRVFFAKGVPVLFAIIADVHKDYHTSRDTSDLINRVDAVHAANLFHEIALGAAIRPEGFAFQRSGPAKASREEAATVSAPLVERLRLGVLLEDGDDVVRVASVNENSTALAAGIRRGDVIVAWNGSKVEGTSSLSALLAKARPGQEVKITVLREGRRVVLPKVELKSPARRGDAPAPTSEPPSQDASARSASKVIFGIHPVYEETDASGVEVAAVTPESPVEGSGILAGDRLLTWNGEEIDGAAGLSHLLRGANPGDEVEIVLQRAGAQQTVTVTLRARDTGK